MTRMARMTPMGGLLNRQMAGLAHNRGVKHLPRAAHDV